jgi:hypothetical protein
MVTEDDGGSHKMKLGGPYTSKQETDPVMLCRDGPAALTEEPKNNMYTRSIYNLSKVHAHIIESAKAFHATRA